MAHLAYAGMLAFCLAATLPLAWAFRLSRMRRTGRVLATLVLAGSPFLVWDLLATHAGEWWFDAAQTLPPRLLGVPLEEIAFFAVVPCAALITFETVDTLLRRRRAGATR